ncbi:hypothetical protein [Enterococcus innesii]|uniref:hypothetical protein n=1 Tax=Enterococcus innesii TaxID=2839759 RepID=UPI003D095FBD
MIKTEKIYGFLQSTQMEAAQLRLLIENWFALVRLSYQPTEYYYNQQAKKPYDLDEVSQLLHSAPEKINTELIVTDGQNESSIHIIQEAVLQRHLFTKDVFSTQKPLILSYFDETMQRDGLFGYLRSYDEYLMHNVEGIEKRQNFQSIAEINALPKRKNFEQEIVIDCNQFSGYDVFYNGYTLTSCWRMYFSAFYAHIIPQVIITDAQQVEQVQVRDQGGVMVELYRDPFQWDHELNLSYQRLFRDQTGIDQLTWDNGVGILREPYIEYAFGDHLIQTIQYQNDRLQPTTKRSATHFVTRSFDLVNEEYQERRVKGYLNAQAYFPWVDQERLRMMDYIVLKPELTIDDGVEAYSFYIRSHLEIEYSEDRFKDYTACLQFYLPETALKHLPLDALKAAMPDVHFGYLHRTRKYTWVNLKKDGKKLRVYFMNTQKLVEQQLFTNQE